jgi:hypothetical protein
MMYFDREMERARVREEERTRCLKRMSLDTIDFIASDPSRWMHATPYLPRITSNW